MRKFQKIAERVDVLPLLLELQRQPELWNRNPARLSEKGPHYQTDDIWIRYKDETENKKSGDWRNFADPHDPIWYPAYYSLPTSRRLIFDLMARVEGERLGGILIWRVPPGGQIKSHTDSGWHVEYYDKFIISLKSGPGCTFFYEDERFDQVPGDCHWFTNTTPHWVKNESPDDYITMTVCIKTHKYGEIQCPTAG